MVGLFCVLLVAVFRSGISEFDTSSMKVVDLLGPPKFDTKTDVAPVLTIPAKWNQGLGCGAENFCVVAIC